MDSGIKSGKEILDDFFNTVRNINGVDEQIASTIEDLYKEGKLSQTNVSNALLKLREETDND